VNGIQQKDAKAVINTQLLLEDKVMVLRHGKSSFRIIEVLTDEEAEYNAHSNSL
jgi:hypothetical protein